MNAVPIHRLTEDAHATREALPPPMRWLPIPARILLSSSAVSVAVRLNWRQTKPRQWPPGQHPPDEPSLLAKTTTLVTFKCRATPSPYFQATITTKRQKLRHQKAQHAGHSWCLGNFYTNSFSSRQVSHFSPLPAAWVQQTVWCIPLSLRPRFLVKIHPLNNPVPHLTFPTASFSVLFWIFVVVTSILIHLEWRPIWFSLNFIPLSHP